MYQPIFYRNRDKEVLGGIITLSQYHHIEEPLPSLIHCCFSHPPPQRKPFEQYFVLVVNTDPVAVIGEARMKPNVHSEHETRHRTGKLWGNPHNQFRPLRKKIPPGAQANTGCTARDFNRFQSLEPQESRSDEEKPLHKLSA